MKLNFSLLRNCAFATTLLSLPQMSIYAEESMGAVLQNNVSQEELMISANSGYHQDEFGDLLFEETDLSSSLVAGNSNNRRQKPKNRQQPVANYQTVAPQVEQAQVSQNSWVPRFVWLGEVENQENLKCLAAFLIGSLPNEEGVKKADFNPGVFITPNSSQTASANMNNGFMSKENMTAQKSRHPHQNQKAPARTNPRPKAPKPRVTMDLAGGANFLFFTGYKGNLAPRPIGLFSLSGPGADYQVKGRPNYNVAPFLEMAAAFNVYNWLSFGPYLQSVQGIAFSTDTFLHRSIAVNTMVSGNFSSDLDLNAVGGRVMFNISNLVKFKTWCFGIIAGGGAGGGFQTWKNAQGYMIFKPAGTVAAAELLTENFKWRTRYAVNFSYTADAAFTFKSRNPYASMSLLKLGCKFIGWGRSKELGKATNPGYPISYFKPVTLEGIYSIAPYLGFEWSF